MCKNDMLLNFGLNEKQYNQYRKWCKKHKKCSNIGSNIVVIFRPTGIGTITIITCSICKKELDLTDVENW